MQLKIIINSHTNNRFFRCAKFDFLCVHAIQAFILNSNIRNIQRILLNRVLSVIHIACVSDACTLRGVPGRLLHKVHQNNVNHSIDPVLYLLRYISSFPIQNKYTYANIMPVKALRSGTTLTYLVLRCRYAGWGTNYAS